MSRALARERLADYSGVAADASRVIKLEPENQKAYLLKGTALAALGKSQEAADTLSKAIGLGAAGRPYCSSGGCCWPSWGVVSRP